VIIGEWTPHRRGRRASVNRGATLGDLGIREARLLCVFASGGRRAGHRVAGPLLIGRR